MTFLTVLAGQTRTPALPSPPPPAPGAPAPAPALGAPP